MKWDAVKKGIPCNVSCCKDKATYHTILQILQLISKNLQKLTTSPTSYIKNLQQTTSPTNVNKGKVKK